MKYRCAGFTYIGSASLRGIDCGDAMFCQGVILPRKNGDRR